MADKGFSQNFIMGVDFKTKLADTETRQKDRNSNSSNVDKDDSEMTCAQPT
jgi:hypothetical protein